MEFHWVSFLTVSVSAIYILFINSYLTFEGKIRLSYQLEYEVGQSTFNTYEKIYNWQPFMRRVYVSIPLQGAQKPDWVQ